MPIRSESTYHSRRPQLHGVEQPSGALDLATLDREHAHLAGDAGQQEHGGVDRPERDVQVRAPARQSPGPCPPT